MKIPQNKARIAPERPSPARPFSLPLLCSALLCCSLPCPALPCSAQLSSAKSSSVSNHPGSTTRLEACQHYLVLAFITDHHIPTLHDQGFRHRMCIHSILCHLSQHLAFVLVTTCGTSLKHDLPVVHHPFSPSKPDQLIARTISYPLHHFQHHHFIISHPQAQ